MLFLGLFSSKEKAHLNEGLRKTKETFWSKLTRSLSGKDMPSTELLNNLEEALLTADVGLETTEKILSSIEKKFTAHLSVEELLREEIMTIFKSSVAGNSHQANPTLTNNEHPINEQRPYVLMVVGVNGVGKTTSIGKLAYRFKQEGKSVVLGAADTFRAAAIDQLKVWGQRAGVSVISQQPGADPAAVAFDTLNSAVAKQTDVVIIDTAGRLHNKRHLMEELAKIRRVMKKVVPDAPHEVLLVLDASTGQNAIQQAKQFSAIVDVTGIILTKLDGTAKGGVIIGIADQLKIPVKYIGIGEQIDALEPFDSKAFVESLLEK